MQIFIQLALAVVLSIVGYLLTPKPKIPTVEAQEFDPPDARADKPMVIVFGTKKIKDVNCLFAGDKSTRKRKT
jgi:hypothetical protein